MLLSKLNFATEHIIKNYSFSIPKLEEEVISFLSRAKYMKRVLSENQFNDWLMEKEI